MGIECQNCGAEVMLPCCVCGVELVPIYGRAEGCKGCIHRIEAESRYRKEKDEFVWKKTEKYFGMGMIVSLYWLLGIVAIMFLMGETALSLGEGYSILITTVMTTILFYSGRIIFNNNLYEMSRTEQEAKEEFERTHPFELYL